MSKSRLCYIICTGLSFILSACAGHSSSNGAQPTQRGMGHQTAVSSATKTRSNSMACPSAAILIITTYPTILPDTLMQFISDSDTSNNGVTYRGKVGFSLVTGGPITNYQFLLSNTGSEAIPIAVTDLSVVLQSTIQAISFYPSGDLDYLGKRAISVKPGNMIRVNIGITGPPTTDVYLQWRVVGRLNTLIIPLLIPQAVLSPEMNTPSVRDCP